MKKADIGMIGMAVMGENLSMNMERHGYRVAVYDVWDGVVDRFMDGRGKGKNFIPCHSFEELIENLEKPRVVMMMIRAGAPVDETIGKLLPLLDKGDIIIDGGNSHFPDTQRRCREVEEHGMLYIGTGVSGGAEGAFIGPSMMPGGSPAAWERVKPILQDICAKVEDGSPCCDWVGEDGAGHFVKMVHNGIEYGDMQLICDKDTDGEPMVEKILDTAGQKGTGKWTAIAALDEGIPLTLIGEAVFARCLSAAKEERVKASKILSGPSAKFSGDRAAFINDLGNALYASKIVSYAQGYSLMRSAAGTYGWNLNYGGIALMWRGGCIIRSVFLGKIKEAFDKNPDITNLMLDGYFKDALENAADGWRRVCAAGITSGVPMPAMTSALSYFDGYRTERLPANLLQAQRDYFGAHTYERVDAERGKFFHTDWNDGEVGNTASTQYNV